MPWVITGTHQKMYNELHDKVCQTAAQRARYAKDTRKLEKDTCDEGFQTIDPIVGPKILENPQSLEFIKQGHFAKLRNSI